MLSAVSHGKESSSCDGGLSEAVPGDEGGETPGGKVWFEIVVGGVGKDELKGSRLRARYVLGVCTGRLQTPDEELKSEFVI